MKTATFGILVVIAGAMQAMAAPTEANRRPAGVITSSRRAAGILERQNDMPKCEDGENGPGLFDIYDNAHCDNQCTYEETSGDNKGQVCTGQCKMEVPPVSPGGGQSMPYYHCVGYHDD